MNYYCLKNTHRFLPVLPRFYWNKKNYEWEVVLDESCIYSFPPDGMKAWNKLVGISNRMNPRKDSLRFVWKYDWHVKMFRIAVFYEKNSEFKGSVYEVGMVKPGQKFIVGFDCKSDLTYCYIGANVIRSQFAVRKLSFRLNPWFGGRRKSPSFMSLNIKTRK